MASMKRTSPPRVYHAYKLTNVLIPPHMCVLTRVTWFSVHPHSYSCDVTNGMSLPDTICQMLFTTLPTSKVVSGLGRDVSEVVGRLQWFLFKKIDNVRLTDGTALIFHPYGGDGRICALLFTISSGAAAEVGQGSALDW